MNTTTRVRNGRSLCRMNIFIPNNLIEMVPSKTLKPNDIVIYSSLVSNCHLIEGQKVAQTKWYTRNELSDALNITPYTLRQSLGRMSELKIFEDVKIERHKRRSQIKRETSEDLNIPLPGGILHLVMNDEISHNSAFVWIYMRSKSYLSSNITNRIVVSKVSSETNICRRQVASHISSLCETEALTDMEDGTYKFNDPSGYNIPISKKFKKERSSNNEDKDFIADIVRRNTSGMNRIKDMFVKC